MKNYFAHICTLLFFTLTVNISPSHGRTRACSELFSTTPAQNGREGLPFVMEKLFGESEPVPYALNEVWNSQELQRFAREKSIPWFSEASYNERYAVISEFVHAMMSQYRDPSYLFKVQNEVRLDRLRRQGFDVGTSRNSMEILRKQSRKNVERVLRENPDSDSPQLPEAELKIITDLEIILSHNSGTLNKPPKYPIIAAREFEKLGLRRYFFSLNTKAFNTVLGSDRHLYNFIKFKRPLAKSELVSEYGYFGITVRNDYAQKHAWVSPFIMNPPELHAAVKPFDTKLAEDLKNFLPVDAHGNLSIHTTNNSVALAKPAIDKAQAELHKLGFTFSDYNGLVKELLVRKLRTLKIDEPTVYADAIDNLRSGSSIAVNNVIHKFAIRHMTSPLPFEGLGFEATVPIGVPDEFVGHFSGDH